MKKIASLLFPIILPALAQQPKFEMTDVHASPTAHGFAQNFGGVLREGKYVNRDVTLLKLIASAYGLSEDNIAGGPSWLSSDLFDVIAKVPGGANREDVQIMLQNLLADRFKLTLHKESREVPLYELVAAKGGKKTAVIADSQGATPYSNSPQASYSCGKRQNEGR